MAKATKRAYRRRTDEERLADLESKLEDMKRRIEERKRKDSPVLKDIPRLQKRLRKFAQLAIDHGRDDLANSTMAFVAGLDRVWQEESPSAKRRPNDDDDE